MKLFKIFVLLILLTFLAGCAPKQFIPCPQPGHPNTTGGACHYRLFVEEVKDGKVYATLPEDVLKQNAENNFFKDIDYKEYYKDYPRDVVHSFRVEDPAQVKPKTEMRFVQEPVSDKDKKKRFDNILKVEKRSAKIKINWSD